LGGIPVVHLVEASDSAGAWGRDIIIPKAEDGTGSFDHVAFRGDDFGAMRERLKTAGVTFKERVVPGGRLSQLFVLDPKACWSRLTFVKLKPIRHPVRAV
jgi:hypothetical protein